MAVDIRFATRTDAPAFIALIQALADFEKLPGPDDAARERLIEHAFGANPKFEVLVAEVEGEIVSYAIFFPTYSTFRAKPTLFLEDLFVHPRARRLGWRPRCWRACAPWPRSEGAEGSSGWCSTGIPTRRSCTTGWGRRC